MEKTQKLNEKHPAVKYLKKRDRRLAKLIDMVGEIEYVSQKDCFARLIYSIVNQMLSNKVAHILGGRLEKLCNGTITAKSLLKLDRQTLRSIGLSYLKADYILGVAKAANEGAIHFSLFPKMDDDDIINELTHLRGIGTWSAKMYLLFTLNRPDVLPYEDVAFLQTYKWLYKTEDLQPESVKKKCKKWKPYSSIAARYFYYALDMGLTKKEFHLFK